MTRDPSDLSLRWSMQPSVRCPGQTEEQAQTAAGARCNTAAAQRTLSA
jgi:hypothetical protein